MKIELFCYTVQNNFVSSVTKGDIHLYLNNIDNSRNINHFRPYDIHYKNESNNCFIILKLIEFGGCCLGIDQLATLYLFKMNMFSLIPINYANKYFKISATPEFTFLNSSFYSLDNIHYISEIKLQDYLVEKRILI